MRRDLKEGQESWGQGEGEVPGRGNNEEARRAGAGRVRGSDPEAVCGTSFWTPLETHSTGHAGVYMGH